MPKRIPYELRKDKLFMEGVNLYHQMMNAVESPSTNAERKLLRNEAYNFFDKCQCRFQRQANS